MAFIESPKQRLAEVVRSLEQDGFLDVHFRLSQAVKKFSGSFAFLELISTFRSDCQSALRVLAQEMNQPIINFHDMDELCIKMKGSSSSIGIPRMTLACRDLRRAICKNSKEECTVALNQLKLEFEVIQDKLDHICQLERKIVTLELQLAGQIYH